MLSDLLRRTLKQADQSLPPVRAAARMRIARVQSTIDQGQARVIFGSAIDEVSGFPQRDRQFFFEQAQQIAAAFAPGLLREIPSVCPFHEDFYIGRLVSTMLENGHIDAAFDYVVRCDVPFSFPFMPATNLMLKLDDERRLTVLSRAIEAWQALYQEAEQLMQQPKIRREMGHSGSSRFPSLQMKFLYLIRYQWQLLPPDRARAVVREIVRVAMEHPDSETSAGYGQDVHITSAREHVLFEVLHILRHLDAPLAKSLIANHAQLAAAARRYPNGLETIQQEAEEHRKQPVASGANCEGWFIIAGGPSDFDYQMALRQSSQTGDFGPSIDLALKRYFEDTDPASPNQAPKTFWPSTCEFRNILYNAGKQMGSDAETLLDRNLDDDLRLFAQIELAAALAGLPELPETQREQRRPPPMQGTPISTSDGSPIRCPECRWVPVEEARWPCKCGHIWNTFETRGLCPACQYQWEVTQCLGCHELSSHAAWYPLE